MQGAKLKTLNKPDTLSQWQKEQQQKNYYNPEMYLKQPTIDPWALGRKETKIVKEVIPATSNLNFQFTARHRNNKEMNRAIHDQKILNKSKLFQ